ncbi:MAG: PIN domain-containing protein [Candidatus Methanodesulfokora sp.]
MLRARAVLDTSVIIEYVNRAGKLHKQASLIFKAINAGKLRAVIPNPVIAETFYVASRVYLELKLSDPIKRAEKLVHWIYRHPGMEIMRSFDLDVEAGRIKLEHGLSLTDCYVLAASKILGIQAVFRKREKEMKDAEVLKEEFKLIFLEDYV